MIRTRKNPVALILLLLAGLLAAAAGCGAPGLDQPGPALPKRDTLTIGAGRDFHYGPSDRTFLHGSTNVWESLVYLDEQLQPVPWLAKKFYPSPDGLTWTFELREGIRFHDGSVMDAETVRENLLRLSRHPGTSAPYRNLVEVRAAGPLTVEVKLSVPVPAFPELISYFNSAMFSRAVLNAETNGLKAPVSTGPYVFDGYKDQVITLKAFPGYWGGPPQIETVIFKYIPDENTRVAALQAGEVDALADVGVILPEQVPLLQANKDIQLLTVKVLTSIYMVCQTEKAPLDNPAVRRAVALLLDREQLVDKLLGGYGTPAKGYISPLAQFWVNPAAAPRFEPEAARGLIKSHLAGPATVEILVNANWARRWPILSIAQYLQTELGKQGITAALKSLEMGAYNDAVRAKEYHITFTPWTGSDPDEFFSAWIRSGGNFNTSRGVGFSDAEADSLIIEAASEMNRERRRELYFTLQELVAEKTPLSPIYHDMTIYATRSYVRGFTMDFNFRPNLHAARFE